MRAVALVVVLLAAVSCSGDDADEAASERSTSSSTTTSIIAAPVPEGVHVELLSSAVVGVADRKPLSEKMTEDVLRIVELYVQRAMVDPLVTSAKATQLDTLFSATSVKAALGPDRPLLVDEGLPRIMHPPSARANVRLLGFRGPDGKVALVGAKVRLRVKGQTADGRTVDVVRAGELSLVPEGHWRIESYDLDVDRQVVAA